MSSTVRVMFLVVPQCFHLQFVDGDMFNDRNLT